MEDLIYWVWLTSKRYITPHKITTLLEHLGNVRTIYESDSYPDIEGIGMKEKRELLNKSTDNAEKIIEKMNLLGGKIVTIDSPEYPESLREIQPPPYVLYMKGQDIKWSENLAIGVIGSRQCTEYGKVAARKLCYELAMTGVLIVSGMARGIDSLAAASALRAGGKTVAVLGGGLDVVYPPENEKLMQAITENGVVITEYPPSTRPYPQNFPQRNRIISGLSRGLLVVEASRKSGTFITVDYARSYGRDIFAIPGGIFRDTSEGTNLMIKRGAFLTTSVRDIFERYPYEVSIIQRASGKPVYISTPDYPRKAKQKQSAPKQPSRDHTDTQPPVGISIDDDRYKGLNEDEKSIISHLMKKNMHIDELSRETGIDIKNLNAILPVLEMMGHITKLPGNNYKLSI